MSCEEKTCETDGSSNCKSSDGCNLNSGCSMSDEIFSIANEAWRELLKEKMKKEFEKQRGEKMNGIAVVGVEGAMNYWQNMMAGKGATQEFQEKLKQAFMKE